MKKLVLNKTTFSGGEVLSRAQLKKVLGGTETTTTKKTCEPTACNSGNDCGTDGCKSCYNTGVNPGDKGSCGTTV